MRYEFVKDDSCLTLRFYGDRKKALVYRQGAVMLALALFYLAIFRDPHYLNASLRILGKLGGFSILTYTVIRQQFAICSLIVDDKTITLERKLFGLSRRRVFPRSDTERLGYEPENQSDDAAFALMVRTVMMPMRFAHGMPPDEAQQIFDNIHSSGCWIGNLIRPVGVPMF